MCLKKAARMIMNETVVKSLTIPSVCQYPISERKISIFLDPFIAGTPEYESAIAPGGPYSIDVFSTAYLRITGKPRSPTDWEPGTGTLTLSDPCVFQCHGAVFSPEGVLYDRSLHPIPEALNTYLDIDNYLGVHTDTSAARAAAWFESSPTMRRLNAVGRLFRGKTRRIPPLVEFRSPVLLFFDHYYYNFTHFLVEAYPRLFAMRELLSHFVPIIPMSSVDGVAPEYSYILACLQSLGICTTSCISMHDRAYYSLESITFPSHVKMHPRYVVPAIGHLCEFYSDRAVSVKNERIYISREHAPGRKLRNAIEVEETLRQRGFRKVVMENFTFREKVNIMRRARVLVCSDGSSVTNAVFMARKAKILAFRPQVFPNYNVVLSALFGHSFYCQVCPFATADQSWVTGDLFVDIPTLEKNLQQLL